MDIPGFIFDKRLNRYFPDSPANRARIEKENKQKIIFDTSIVLKYNIKSKKWLSDSTNRLLPSITVHDSQEIGYVFGVDLTRYIYIDSSHIHIRSYESQSLLFSKQYKRSSYSIISNVIYAFPYLTIVRSEDGGCKYEHFKFIKRNHHDEYKIKRVKLPKLDDVPYKSIEALRIMKHQPEWVSCHAIYLEESTRYLQSLEDETIIPFMVKDQLTALQIDRDRNVYAATRKGNIQYLIPKDGSFQMDKIAFQLIRRNVKTRSIARKMFMSDDDRYMLVQTFHDCFEIYEIHTGECLCTNLFRSEETIEDDPSEIAVNPDLTKIILKRRCQKNILEYWNLSISVTDPVVLWKLPDECEIRQFHALFIEDRVIINVLR